MKIIKFVSPEKAPAPKEAPPFERFYEDNYSKVLGYLAGKTANRSDAEDLAGEVFLYCYDHYADFDPSRSSISTWLFLIVNSRLKNYYRDRTVHADLGELENVLYEESDEMDKAVYLEQLRERIALSLEKLPERQRKIVVMRYFKGMEYAEIARLTDTSPGNVRVILSRALDRMEADFEEFTY